MKNASFGISSEGFPIILLFAFSTLICAILNYISAAFCFFLVTWFSCYFFRDPERVCPSETDVAISPADGKIIKIENSIAPTGKNCICISIFMNLFDVHVNRMPVSAEIKDIRYYPGKFFNASLDKASKYNEHCVYFLESKKGNFVMVQIAGLIAQRIVCRAEIGDKLNKGERFGMIKFGSRVDVYIPDTYTPVINIGQKVFAGQSVIAKCSHIS